MKAVAVQLLLSALCCTLTGAVCCRTTNDGRLIPGADTSDCRSALRLGPVECKSADPGAANQSMRGERQQLDADASVEAFLANYGKPPREAVRALLNPTDENIRALMRQQEQTLAVAAYVAERMTALQRRVAQFPRDEKTISRDLPSFLQMRITLIQNLGDPTALPAMHALRDLAFEAPVLRAGVGFVGPLDDQQLREGIARVEEPLSVTVLPAQANNGQDLPRILIEDLRYGRSLAIDARTATAALLRSRILVLRNASEASGDGARAAASSMGNPEAGVAAP